MIRFYIISVLSFIFCASAYSQVSEYRFRTISIEEGLSQSTVNAIFQDSKGFLWFGTNDGLNRYDGRSLSMIKKLNEGKVQTIRGRITGINEGKDSKLYIANYGVGLVVYDISKGNYKIFSHSDEDINSLQSNYLLDVLCTNDTTVWLATEIGISRFNIKENTFENYPVLLKNGTESYSEGVTTLFYDDREQLWIGTKGLGLWKFSEEGNSFIPFVNKTGNGDDWDKNYINDITETRNGLLLVTTKKGLFLFDPQTGLFFEHLINDIELKKIVKDKDNSYWVSSREKGLFQIDSTEKLHHYFNNPYDPRSFPDDQVDALFRDNMQSLWVGTRTHGVVQIVVDHKPFVNIYHAPNKPGIPDNSVFAIAEGKPGEVWIGSVKGLTVWNRKNNSFRRISLKLKGKKTTDFSVWSLYFESEYVLWIGTNKGLIRYNIKHNRNRHYFKVQGNPHSLVYNDVAHIEKDKKGNIWVSTPNGVGKLNKGTNKFTNYYAVDSKDNSIGHNRVWDIYSDSKGRLWFGTEDGLSRYNFDTDDFKTVKFSDPSFNTGNALANSIVCITESKKGELWIGTQGGVFIYDPDKNEIIGFVKVYDNISKEYVYNIIEAENSFWASTNKGLIEISKKDHTIEARYSSKDGLFSDEFNGGAAAKLQDGFILFGGIAGVTGFYPDKIHKSSYCPPVYLTGLSLFGDKVDPANKDVYQRVNFIHSTVSAKSISLTYDEKIVSLNFAALDFTNPKQISYFYRILPISGKWISLGERNVVTIINLKPGKYLLQVKSTNGDGILCNNVKRFDLIVTPPVWREWWVIASGIFLLAVILFFLIRHRVLHLRREKKKLEEIVLMRTKEIQEQRNIANRQRDEIARQKEELQDFAAELENKVRERTRDLEEAKLRAEESDRLKSAFLSNMSHEIRTPMNAIMGFSELLLTKDFNEDERETFVRMVKSNGDALLNLLNDIIDISMIESGQLKFHFSDVKICSLVRDIFFMFKNSGLYKEKKNVELNLVTKIDDVVINTDEDRLRQVITNLLNNALKFTDKGSITLGCEETDNYIRFYVSDTGIGIKDELKNKIFDRFYKIEKTKNIIYGGNGLGLTITKNIIEALDGDIWVESEVGKGTTFWFTVPK